MTTLVFVEAGRVVFSVVSKVDVTTLVFVEAGRVVLSVEVTTFVLVLPGKVVRSVVRSVVRCVAVLTRVDTSFSVVVASLVEYWTSVTSLVCVGPAAVTVVASPSSVT